MVAKRAALCWFYWPSALELLSILGFPGTIEGGHRAAFESRISYLVRAHVH